MRPRITWRGVGAFAFALLFVVFAVLAAAYILDVRERGGF